MVKRQPSDEDFPKHSPESKPRPADPQSSSFRLPLLGIRVEHIPESLRPIFLPEDIIFFKHARCSARNIYNEGGYIPHIRPLPPCLTYLVSTHGSVIALPLLILSLTVPYAVLEGLRQLLFPMIWCLDIGILVPRLILPAIPAAFLSLIISLFIPVYRNSCPLCQRLGCRLAYDQFRGGLIYALCILDCRFTALIDFGRLYRSDAFTEGRGMKIQILHHIALSQGCQILWRKAG
ncbi:hypothetical protein HD806DRAFT_552437 [Xylariaceae sp. AK1471]|nr:hypothetical protein HD806DRAFT_552437 [Xylariaceae sp. AK1471]